MKTRRQLSHFVSTFGILPAALAFVSNALAVDYTYTIPASGTNQWNAGTNWGGATAPVSASTAALIFSGTQTASASATSNNDIVSGGNGFQLNKLSFTGAGPATGTAPTFNVTGNALEFISNGAIAPTLALTGTGTVKPVVNISNNLVLTNNLAVSLATNLTGTLSGVISGTGSLSKSTGTSTLVLSNTANSFSGGVTLANGSMTVANIGNTSSNSALGTNGTVIIASAGNNAQFTWTGSTETSDKTIRITNSTGNATLSAQTSGQTLTLSNSVLLTNVSTKILTFNGAGSFTLSGSIVGSGVSNPATALTKSGAGRLTLSGTASDFTGAVTISQGEIYATTLGSTTTAGSLGKGSVLNMGGTTIGGTLRLVGTSNETTDKTLNLSGTTGGATITVTGATYTFNQPLGITGDGAKTLTLASSGAATGQGIIFNGLIADGTGSAISFRANGSGSANFTLGNAANSFSGGVTVDGNIIAKTYALQVASIGNSGSNSCLGTNGTINLGSTTADSINILRYTGTGETSDKVINLKGTEGDAGIDQSGTGVLKFSSDLTTSGVGVKTFILQGSSAGTGEMAGKIIDSSSAAPTSLSKDGSGTWTLSGVNTYTGGTNIVAGTLALAAFGSIDSSSLVTIGAGATLDTSARSSFSLPAGKTYTFTLDSTDAGSAGRIKAADLDISNASIALASPLLNPPLDDASYVIATYTGTLTGTFGTAAPDGYSWNYGTGTNSQITLVVGGYGSWKGTNAGGQAASLDWDNDSVTNGIEYFMNASAGFTANPTLEVDNSITWTNGGNILSSAYGTQFVVQTSSDLVSWADVPVGELDTNSATTLKYTLTGANKRFVRLMVTPAE